MSEQSVAAGGKDGGGREVPACLSAGGGGGGGAAAAVCSLARSVAPAPTCHGLVVANVDGYI